MQGWGGGLRSENSLFYYRLIEEYRRRERKKKGRTGSSCDWSRRGWENPKENGPKHKLRSPNKQTNALHKKHGR